MTASASFTIDTLATPPIVTVAASATIDVELVSVTGVDTIAWSIVGKHSFAASTPTITPAGSPLGSRASFPTPAGSGQCYRIKCVVNAGRADEDTKYGICGVPNDGGRIPYALGEELERHSTYGYTEALNAVSSLPIRTGTGSPESAVAAPVGSLFLRTDGGASTTLYVKESGSGSTGWKAVQTL